jgi:hypothetical protein|tara:strand:+ start:7654 stop:9507 length:1854 start_codon:yes stop_codon:yes gene_type:complete
MSKIKLVNLATYTSPTIEVIDKKDYVTYGPKNSYFQYLIDRYTGSPTNNAIINGVSQMVYGEGLMATDSEEKPLEWAEVKLLMSDECVRKLVYDLKLLGQCAIQVAYNKDRTKISEVGHIPVETLAMEVADKDDGEIKGFYYCGDWEKIKPNQELKRIPAFGTSLEPVEILYVRPYVAGHYYYSPVDYQGGLQYAELEEEISNYHLNNIMNGLAPSMLINFNNGVPNEEERENIEQAVRQKFSGSSNAGKFILSFNENTESSSSIEPVQLSDAHNQYQFLSDESMKKIMVAHRVVSPMLLGIKDQTGLGNNAEELKTASTLMDNIVIRPIQNLLLIAFDEILNFNGISLDLYFKTLQPLEFADLENAQSGEQIEKETGEKDEDTTTVNDLELGECKVELSEEDKDLISTTLAREGTKGPEGYVYVAEMDEDAGYDIEDWANYLIKEKPTTLNKLKKAVGLKDYVTSRGKGSEWSSLDSKNGLYKIRYKYARGMRKSGKSRDFCRNMMNMSNAGIVWRIEDIERASWKDNVNVEFRHRPSIRYNIFELKGGIYCQHKWVRVLYRLESNTEVSKNLGNYNKTRTIPSSYLKNPRGSKKASIATDRLPGRGAWPSKRKKK